MSEFGARLKIARKSKKLKQREIADCLSMTERAYRAWEGGSREPSIDKLIVLADYFDVTLDWLCGRVPEEPFGGR